MGLSTCDFVHEAHEALAVQRRVDAAQLAPHPAYPLVPSLRMLRRGVHLRIEYQVGSRTAAIDGGKGSAVSVRYSTAA